MITTLSLLFFLSSRSIATVDHPLDIKVTTKTDLELSYGEIACTTCHLNHVVLDKKGAFVRPYEELCISCHKEFVNKNHNHVNLGKSKESCQDCHKIHKAETGKILISKQQVLCISCHKETKLKGHSGVEKDPKLNCTACHKIHTGDAKLNFSKKETCIECHEQFKKITIKSKHLKPEFLKEKFKWTSNESTCLHCHGPHKEKLSQVNQCNSCHKEKKKEHPVVKQMDQIAKVRGMPKGSENVTCLTCHDPHTGTKETLPGVMEKLRNLCSACHGKGDHFFKDFHKILKNK